MNPERLQYICSVVMVTGMIVASFGAFGYRHYTKKVDQKKQEVASDQIGKLSAQNSELIAGKDKVVAQNDELLGKIGKYQQDLKEKEEKIRELGRKAKMSARNVTSMYDFNGAKRETSGGKVNFVVGEELGVFQQMVGFAKANDLPNLIKLCERQIEKTPDWYTPYFYLGMAQADTGLKDEAIKNIRYVVDNTPGDLEYTKAHEVLEMLEQQP